MAHTEADRKAFYADIEKNEYQKQHDAAINAWLADNPRIGMLQTNYGASFYIIEDGIQKSVEPLEKIN